MSRSQGQGIMSNYTTYTGIFEDKVEKQRLREVYHNSKWIVHNEDGEVIQTIKHQSVSNKSFSKAKKRLNEDSKFQKIIKVIPELYFYTLNFKDINVKCSELNIMYHKQRYEAMVSYLDKQIQGKAIYVLQFGISTGLHAHILCGKQHNKMLKAEELVTDYTTLVYYLSKEIVAPIKKKKFKESYVGHYQDVLATYEAIAGKVVENSLKKKKRQRQVIYRLSR